MDKLIESLLNINIRKNEGYIFVKQEDIYVPIIKTVLSITKRSFYRLPLLEEIVLRLINENLQEIDELANVLGIDRKLLEVTLADLSVKDIIYCTTNRCTLLSKGKQALKDLRTVQRRKDTIKNIYLDPINKKIITDYDNYQFIDKVVYNNDKKLEADITVNNIEIFKENIESVNKVFLDETLPQLLDGDALFVGAADHLIVDIREILNVLDLVALVLQIAAQRVEHDERARIADVEIVVDRRAAAVNAHLARLDGLELFFPARLRVINLHHLEYPP